MLGNYFNKIKSKLTNVYNNLNISDNNNSNSNIIDESFLNNNYIFEQEQKEITTILSNLDNILSSYNLSKDYVDSIFSNNDNNKNKELANIISKYYSIEKETLSYLENYKDNRIIEKYYFNNSHYIEITRIIYTKLFNHFDLNIIKSNHNIKILDIIKIELDNFISEVINKKDIYAKYSKLIDIITSSIKAEEDYESNMKLLVDNIRNNFYNRINSKYDYIIKKSINNNSLIDKLNFSTLISSKQLHENNIENYDNSNKHINNFPLFILIDYIDNIEEHIYKIFEDDLKLFSLKENAYKGNFNYKILESYYSLYKENSLNLFDISIIPDNIKLITIELVFFVNKDLLILKNNIQNSFISNIIDTFNERILCFNYENIMYKYNSYKDIISYKEKIVSSIRTFLQLNEKSQEKVRFYVFSLYTMFLSNDYKIKCKQRLLFFKTLNFIILNYENTSFSKEIKSLVSLLEKLYSNDLKECFNSNIDNITNMPKINYSNIIDLIKENDKLYCLYKKNVEAYINLNNNSNKFLKVLKASISAYEVYNSFKNNNNNYLINNVTNNNITTNVNKDLIEKVDIDLNLTSLIKTKHKDNSPTITILISGFLSQEDNQLATWREILKLRENRSDIYLLPWQASSNIDFATNLINNTANSIISLTKVNNNNINLLDNKDKSSFLKHTNEFAIAKKRSKYIGKILAYILASRKVFDYKSINLVGFSLGCNVIKHCLKELMFINNYGVLNNCYVINNLEVSNCINNVMTIAGATQLDLEKKKSDRDKLKLINGRYINVYSDKDMILSVLFKMSVTNQTPAIGIIELKDIYDKDEEDNKQILSNKLLKIENINYSSMNIGHTYYRSMMDKVFKDSKIFSN